MRADGAKVTAEDGWAADGLDLSRIPADSRGHDYKFMKGEPGPSAQMAQRSGRLGGCGGGEGMCHSEFTHQWMSALRDCV